MARRKVHEAHMPARGVNLHLQQRVPRERIEIHDGDHRVVLARDDGRPDIQIGEVAAATA